MNRPQNIPTTEQFEMCYSFHHQHAPLFPGSSTHNHAAFASRDVCSARLSCDNWSTFEQAHQQGFEPFRSADIATSSSMSCSKQPINERQLRGDHLHSFSAQNSTDQYGRGLPNPFASLNFQSGRFPDYDQWNEHSDFPRTRVESLDEVICRHGSTAIQQLVYDEHGRFHLTQLDNQIDEAQKYSRSTNSSMLHPEDVPAIRSVQNRQNEVGSRDLASVDQLLPLSDYNSSPKILLGSGLLPSGRPKNKKLHLSQQMIASVEQNQFSSNVCFNLRLPSQYTLARVPQPQRTRKISPLNILARLCSQGFCGSQLTRNNSKEMISSHTLFVTGFKEGNFSLKQICSLFSNYGNINFGVSFKSSDSAFIMYSTHLGAELGLQHLKTLTLRGRKVKIDKIQHFDGLDPCQLSEHPEIYLPPQSNKRFKQEVPKQANAVSSTLHVCIFYGGKRRIVSNNELSEHFKAFGVSPQQLRRDPNPEHFNMWFMDFKTNSEAIICLMKAHDSPFEDGNVRISFTKSKKTSDRKKRGD